MIPSEFYCNDCGRTRRGEADLRFDVIHCGYCGSTILCQECGAELDSCAICTKQERHQ